MAFDLTEVIRHLIDGIVDDEAFATFAEQVAGLAPYTSLVIRDQASEPGTPDGKVGLGNKDPKPHASLRAQSIEVAEFNGLNLLAELLTQVLQARQRPVAQEPNLAQVVLDGQIDAVLVIDASGVLQFANASALRLMEISNVLTLCGGRLSSPEPLVASSLRKLIRSAGKGHGGGGLSFPASMPGYRGTVESLPCANAPLVCIRLRDEKTWAAMQANRARARHGLTAAETRLAEAVLLGLRPIDIAEQRSVSMSTIRTQLRSLYIKTGVTGQAELKKTLEAF
jgi:DNA-binding CsgD family transcriptional regulator